jgi:HTH-type transcriptional regulator, transcriptional repressor of NAD biosynthesis genes
VRPDELPRIALLGGESSGKTTLAVALAERLHTLWVPEYGRMLWEELRVTLDPQQLVHVAQTQVAWEHEHAARALAMGARWLVCDTTPLTTLQYCLHDHGHAPPALQALAQRRYTLTVLCDSDFAFVQDGCRRDDGFRQAQHAWTLARLAERGVQPLVVRGSVAGRVTQVLDRIEHLPSDEAFSAPAST